MHRSLLLGERCTVERRFSEKPYRQRPRGAGGDPRQGAEGGWAAPSCSDEIGRLLLPDVLEQIREADAEPSCELGGGLHGRIPKPCLNGSDVRPIQIGLLGQPLLSPGLGLSEVPDAGAKRQQQAVASLRHAPDCREAIGVSMDDQ